MRKTLRVEVNFCDGERSHMKKVRPYHGIKLYLVFRGEMAIVVWLSEFTPFLQYLLKYDWLFNEIAFIVIWFISRMHRVKLLTQSYFRVKWVKVAWKSNLLILLILLILIFSVHYIHTHCICKLIFNKSLMIYLNCIYVKIALNLHLYHCGEWIMSAYI